MSGDWVKIEHVTPDKPEVFKIADRLEIDPDAVVGKLCRIWIWFDQQSRSCHVPGVTLSLLDRLAGVTGFGSALISVGWLEEEADGLHFVNIDRHMSQTAKNRALANARKKKQRSGVTDESRLERDSGVTREEKRREDSTAPPSGEGDKPPPKPTIPVQDIVDLYHEILPELPQCRKLTTTRRGFIRQRWIEDLKSLDEWREYFESIRSMDWLMGRGTPQPGRKVFVADLEWITRPGNFSKIIEGKYFHEETSGNTGNDQNPRRLAPHERVRARAEQRARERAGETVSAMGGDGRVLE